MCPFKMAKFFNTMPKWRTFDKSGHTGTYQRFGKGKMFERERLVGRPKNAFLSCLSWQCRNFP